MTTSRPTRTHVRDGLALCCLGVAGWGIAPLAAHPGLALPAVAGGIGAGVTTIGLGHRASRRADLVTYATAALAPLLGTAAHVTVKAWTSGWPGTAKRVQLRYSVGRIKLAADPPAGGPFLPPATAVVEMGGPRWVSEITRQVGERFGATYKTAANDPVRGRLSLRLVPTPEEKPEAPESPQVARAKRVVNELLAGTAAVDQVDVDDAGEVRRLEVRHAVGSKLVAIGYRARVERTLSAMLPGRWRAKWDMEADSVVFEVRPSLPESLWIPPLQVPDSDPLKNYRSVRIPYGVDEDGEVIAWEPAVTPMWLVTGSTGSGKTSTAHGILTQITQFGWPVWIADGKGIEFLGFQDWPNVQIVASKLEEHVAVIHRAWQVMEHRYRLVVEGKARSEDFEPLMVFVDEFTDLKANLLTWYSQIKVRGDASKPVTLSEIGLIARKGRTARVHLVLSMQRPDADILGGEQRENFGQRTSMGPLSPHAAEMMWNSQQIGVALPRGKVGRAIGVNAAGFPVEMQAYRVPDPKDSREGTPEGDLIDRLRPAVARHERLLIVSPETDWDDGLDDAPKFSDYLDAAWVKAADRPDLDPLVHRAALSNTPDGRSLSSPLALLGLAGVPAPKAPPTLRVVNRPDIEVPTIAASADVYFDDYTPSTSSSASSLAVGDLVCVDVDVDEWAVVEDEPIEDFSDPDCLVIAWRDDQDRSGQLLVPSDAVVQVRRPNWE